jgi:Holliday junction resolvase RusA-like endonuclease
MWDSQRYIKSKYGDMLDEQHGDLELFEGPIKLEAWFYFKIPKGLKAEAYHQRRGNYHKQRPDLSNLIKFIEDVASGILYKDDALIASIVAHKVWDENPRTEFTLVEI